MTVEIALLNSYGASLGADTAVSDRIHDFSHAGPAALMVHGDFRFADAAWGAVLDLFEPPMHGNSSLAQIANELVEYLNDEKQFDPQAKETAWEEMLDGHLAQCIWQAGEWAAGTDPATSPNQSPGALLVLAAQSANHELGRSNTILRADENAPDDLVERNRQRFDRVIDQAVTAELSDDQRMDLRRALAEYTVGCTSVGLVVVGYGKRDLYPSVVRIQLHGLDGTELVSTLTEGARIGSSLDACIVPVGQAQDVEAFMYGLHPDIVPERGRDGDQSITALLASATSLLRDRAGTPELQAYATAVIEELTTQFSSAETAWNDQRDRRISELNEHVREGLARLPRQGLADAAEALIGQAILRRTLTMDAEQSLAGSLEVALVSREGGFQLVKSPRLARAALPQPRTR
jgi:hypothetical protein